MKIKTGMDLKVERVKAGATQRDVGRYMGVSPARVSVIERSGNTRGTGTSSETVQRYLDAIKRFVTERDSGRSTVVRTEILTDIGSVQEQYKEGKKQARLDIRAHPESPQVEVQINRDTPAATVIGYIDGVTAAGGLPVLLDERGTVVNRRIG